MYLVTPSPEQTRITRITLLVLIGGAAYLCYLVLRPFIQPLAYGVIAATLAYPLYQSLASRLGRPSLAAFLTTVIVVVAFVVPIAFVISIAVRELRNGFEALAAAGGTDRLWQALEGPLSRVGGWFGTDSVTLRDAVTQRVGAGSAAIARQFFAIAGATAGGIISAVVSLMTVYFALRHGPAFYEQVLTHSPLGARRTERLGSAARGMMVASSYGILAVSAAQGLLCALAAWGTGLPSPVLWGVATAICSVIPLVGSGLVWVPAAIVLFAQGSIGSGIFMLIWGGVLISNIDNFVRPWVLVSQMPVSGLVIFITLLGGIQAFGLIGIFVGPVILAVTMELFEFLREELSHVQIS